MYHDRACLEDGRIHGVRYRGQLRLAGLGMYYRASWWEEMKYQDDSKYSLVAAFCVIISTDGNHCDHTPS